MMNDAAEMLEASKNVKTFDNECYPGMAIHEMGTEWVMILKILFKQMESNARS
jgi:hypothetical protein